MSIKTWQKDGKTHYEVYVTVKRTGERTGRKHRKQRWETGMLEESDPVIVDKKLLLIRDRLRDKAMDEINRLESAGLTWGELIDRWEADIEMKARKSNPEEIHEPVKGRTVDGYVRSVRNFTEAWFELPASEITPADVEDVFQAMRKQGYANCTMYNTKVAISRCFKWGMLRKLIPGATISPTHGFGISRKNSKRPEILNIAQIIKLMTEAYEQLHPWRQVWKGAFHSGGRTGELRGLKRKHVDLVERMVHFEEQLPSGATQPEPLKDGEWRYVPINDELYDLFLELGVDRMANEEYVFPRITAWHNNEQARILRKFCDQIEIPSICFHTLRACWATQLLKNGVPTIKVMAMGGWSDEETMHRYIRLAGIEIQGATQSLTQSYRERPARVLKLLKGGGSETSRLSNSDFGPSADGPKTRVVAEDQG